MLKIIEEIERKKWDELTENSSYTSFFQTKDCFDFYASLTFLKPFVFGVEEDGLLKGLISGYIVANGGKMKQFFSKRAIIHGGVLLGNNITDSTLFFLLKETINRLKKKAIYIEIRNNFDYSAFKRIFKQNGFDYQPHYNYIVSTDTSIEKIDSKISESKSRQVRKAKAQGVVVVETKNEKEIEEFYAILKRLYRDKVKKPLFPREFFEKLITFSTAKLFVAKYKGKVIGGMACAMFNNKTIYEWFVCGEDEKYKHLYPSVIVTYSVIEYAVKNGFSYFDFMGAGKPNEYYGVREFKEKFGGELVEWGRFIHVNDNFRYKLGKMMMTFLNK